MTTQDERIKHLTIVLEGARKYVAKMQADGTPTALSPAAMLRRIDEALGYEVVEQQPIAERILALRLERGWTQAELGRALRATAYFVAELEAGLHSPSVKMLEELAAAFGVGLRVELG